MSDLFDTFGDLGGLEDFGGLDAGQSGRISDVHMPAQLVMF